MFRSVEPLSNPEQKQLSSLRDFFLNFENVCVAYSGGVDSTLVAAIAFEQLGEKAIAVTGVSPSLAPYLLKEAQLQAKLIGIDHIECKTNELKDPLYTSNPNDRCYACKRELHSSLQKIITQMPNSQVLDGVNSDDIVDYRPGIKAASEMGVRSPLAELNIGKNLVRKISKSLCLPWWDKPSQPCLASRFPYGYSITAKKLEQVYKAEQWIRGLGFKNVRVRSQGYSARIELEPNQIESFFLHTNRKEIVSYFLSIGYTSVSLDMEGLISGKLNRSISK